MGFGQFYLDHLYAFQLLNVLVVAAGGFALISLYKLLSALGNLVLDAAKLNIKLDDNTLLRRPVLDTSLFHQTVAEHALAFRSLFFPGQSLS
jgi:hypothetical protein